MSRFLCIIVFLFAWIISPANDKIKEYRKYIKEYDMRDSIKDDLIPGDASSFWKAIMKNNKRYQEVLNAAIKKKKSLHLIL